MIDVGAEIDMLLLALKLEKEARLSCKNGEDDFALFRKFAKSIREYENKKEKRE